MIERGNLRVWASDLDDGTLEQAERVARLREVVPLPVALMPDAHVGIGATVGSVIPTENAVIPSAVGVDIGCGMVASETSLRAEDLPDSLEPFLRTLYRVVPAGVGQGHGFVSAPRRAELDRLGLPTGTELTDRQRSTLESQFGSLGSGNHFFEVCLDEADRVWVVLHSGSRGIGNQLATAHIRIAKELHCATELEDPDLAWFTQGTPEFDRYVADVLWAQRYAAASRDAMMSAALWGFFAFVGGQGLETNRINCHHNYVAREEHDGRELWVTRKGAIRAREGDLGVIPGSMGTQSYIVRGLGNPLSYSSCSHGAGRRMSRSRAKKEFTPADLASAMAGKTWLSDRASALVDEIPAAYKDIDQVMEDQRDLVEAVHVLRQVLNYKGT